jgi:hypothetical protein
MPQVQEALKIGFFEFVYCEQDQKMKNNFAETLGEIAGSLLSNDNWAWPDFKGNVWKLIRDSSLSNVYAGFRVLEHVLKHAPQHFFEDREDLCKLFKMSFENEDNQLKMAALRCFTEYL